MKCDGTLEPLDAENYSLVFRWLTGHTLPPFAATLPHPTCFDRFPPISCLSNYHSAFQAKRCSTDQFKSGEDSDARTAFRESSHLRPLSCLFGAAFVFALLLSGGTHTLSADVNPPLKSVFWVLILHFAVHTRRCRMMHSSLTLEPVLTFICCRVRSTSIRGEGTCMQAGVFFFNLSVRVFVCEFAVIERRNMETWHTECLRMISFLCLKAGNYLLNFL